MWGRRTWRLCPGPLGDCCSPPLAALLVPVGGLSSVCVLDGFPLLHRLGCVSAAASPLSLQKQPLRANRAQQRSTGIAAMKPGEPGQGKHPGTSSCWAPTMRQGSGHPTLLLALMGLLSTPAARGEYGHMGCTAGSSETCPAPPSLLGGWGGRWHHPQAKVLPGMQPSTVPLLRGKSRAALLGCSLGLGNGILTQRGFLLRR